MLFEFITAALGLYLHFIILSDDIYKLTTVITVCREERHIRASAYFINSTVHTSKVIWALKTINKLMNAFYWWEATRLHGATTPSSGRKLKYPNGVTGGKRGWCTSSSSEAERWSRSWFQVRMKLRPFADQRYAHKRPDAAKRTD